MARKRVSLKDKGPETLGLTEKKGQGIDVLFGGPTAARTRSASVASESKITNQPKVEVKNMAADKNNLTNSMVASPESLPVNEADDDLNSATLQGVDELGLPVAMEAPPANLVAAGVTTGEVDELGLPVAMETPPTDLTMPVPPLAPPPMVGTNNSDLSGVADDNDLSGLAGEEQDLSGLATDAAAPPASQPVDLPFTPPAEPAPLPEPPPVPTFTPTPEVLPDRPIPAPPPVTTTVTTTYTPPTYPPAPTPVTVSTSVAPPPPVIESFGGLIATPTAIRPEDLLPQDYQYGAGALQLAERARVERDDLLSEKVERYLGKERRQALDQEIERLYEVVSNELSDNNEDVSFALKTLSEAQDIVLEDIRQYDEALYRVALVKTMLVRRRNLKRWSYTWGTFILFYALSWLVVFITGIVLTGNINAFVNSFAGQSEGLIAASTAWYSALAGGIGGVMGILYSLYWRVAFKQNFDRQYMMYYLVQPIMGFVLGAVTHLIITAGFLTFNNAAGAISSITTLVQLVVGFIAGFRQRVVYLMIDKLVQKVAPEESDKEPDNVVPEQ